MKIGELLKATGVSPRSLRYYEQQDLLESSRTGGGHREYADAAAVERVRLIQTLLAAGLPTATIHDVLPCMVDETIRTRALERRLRDELRRVEERLTALGETRDLLADIVARYRRAG